MRNPNQPLLQRNQPQNQLPQRSLTWQRTGAKVCNTATASTTGVVLLTAVVVLEDDKGNKVHARALLDSAAECNLISRRLRKMLAVKEEASTVEVIGIQGVASKVQGRVTVLVQSRITDYNHPMEIYVLPKIAAQVSTAVVDTSLWDIPKGIQLADPDFLKGERIDLLLGAESFFEFFVSGRRIRLGDNLPSLVDSVFGWVVTGRYSVSGPIQSVLCDVAVSSRLDEILERFGNAKKLGRRITILLRKPDAKTHFAQTVQRNCLVDASEKAFGVCAYLRTEDAEANRVSKVQASTENCHWRHVPGEQNPADQISRGIWPEEIIDNQLWWEGPAWLRTTSENWPSLQAFTSEGHEEERRRAACVITASETSNFFAEYLARFSSFTTLIRTTAYLLRYLHNLRSKRELRRSVGFLTTEELQLAENFIVLHVQRDSFHREVSALTKGEFVPRSSPLRWYHPFVADNGLLRVGGRIGQAKEPEYKIHPIVLPARHLFTKLLMRYYHHRLLHAGPQLMLSFLFVLAMFVHHERHVPFTIHVKPFQLVAAQQATRCITDCAGDFSSIIIGLHPSSMDLRQIFELTTVTNALPQQPARHECIILKHEWTITTLLLQCQSSGKPRETNRWLASS
nr:uncharacterized protein LOC115259897 [Aedes albopictus]